MNTGKLRAAASRPGSNERCTRQGYKVQELTDSVQRGLNTPNINQCNAKGDPRQKVLVDHLEWRLTKSGARPQA